MAFGSIELTTISRTQDYTIIKQNEDNKAFAEQTQIGQLAQKEENQRTKEVRSSGNSDWQSKKFDARDKGDNEYQGDGGSKRQKKDKAEQVIINGHRGFDMKI